MAENTYVNKVIYGGQTLIDLTSDTITAADVINSRYFHLATGERVQGTCTYDADTSDATATSSEILATKTAYVNGTKVTGQMVNNGAYTAGKITSVSGQVAIPVGYHDGSGYVEINATDQAKLIASNIRKDIEILGVTGTMDPEEGVVAATVTVTPYTTSKTYVPGDFDDQDHSYNYFAQFTVSAIAYSETDNAAGGKTVSIGTVDPNAT